MARTKPRRSQGRRSPWAAAALIGVGLLLTGGAYAGASAAMASTTDETSASALTVEDGKKLFQANCATCHGLDLQGTESGPSLYGVGELSVEFQVATGRMPLQMQGPQAPQKPVQFTEEQIQAMAAYVQSTSPGPEFPSPEILDGEGDIARGADFLQRRSERGSLVLAYQAFESLHPELEGGHVPCTRIDRWSDRSS